MPGTEPNTFQALISFLEHQSWKRTYISENLSSLFNKEENWGQYKTKLEDSNPIMGK